MCICTYISQTLSNNIRFYIFCIELTQIFRARAHMYCIVFGFKLIMSTRNITITLIVYNILYYAILIH